MKNKFEIYFSLSIFVKRFIEKIAIIVLLFPLSFIALRLRRQKNFIFSLNLSCIIIILYTSNILILAI